MKTYTDDSEVVVLEGSVGSGTRTIEYWGIVTGAIIWIGTLLVLMELSGVYLDLSAVDSNYDATVTR